MDGSGEIGYLGAAKAFAEFFKQKIEIGDLCKGVYCVDLGESFHMSIYYLVFTCKSWPRY